MTARARRRCAATALGFARIACLVAPLAAVASCYTTTNVVTLAPLQTAYPVSASSQYVDPDGSIVTENDYNVVQPFSFHQAVEARPHNETVTALALEPDLDRIMSKAGGDAITAMTIQATDYQVGSHYPAAGLKLAGWTFGVAGLTIATLGVALGEEEGTTVATVGVVTAGIGAISYLIGRSMKAPASWQLDVRGNIVKRTSSNRARLTTDTRVR
jgi:hypothetical protein